MAGGYSFLGFSAFFGAMRPEPCALINTDTDHRHGHVFVNCVALTPLFYSTIAW
jgi:hypothetical protein